MKKGNKIEKQLRERAIFLLENADRNTFNQMADWAFGEEYLAELLMEMFENWDKEILENFIAVFDNKLEE